jgi:glycosyltransferase involved in cell wall biosynthesis
VIKDGSVPESIEAIISEITSHADFPVEIDELEENRGHGGALRRGVTVASHPLVAIHDADDICIKTRFEKQLEFITETGADVVGGWIAEFEEDPDDPHAIRKVPETHDDIIEMCRFRCPMNQTTVLARRDAILDSGNYRAVDRMEDYELWGRMITNGYKFRNQQTVLAYVRAGQDMYGRRGGFEYAREEIRVQKYFYDIGFLSRRRAIWNTVLRTIPRLLPNQLRGVIYRRKLRD